jgi:hypothetical protein
MTVCYIYSLSDPRNDDVFDIGSSKRKNRYPKKYMHYWSVMGKFGNDRVTEKMFDLVNNGLWYKIDIIDEVNLADRAFWEQYYMSLFYSWGFNLMNKRRYVNKNPYDIRSI